MAGADGPVELGEEFTRDPYAVYARLRERGPVVRALLPGGAPAWLITRYEHARAALTDGRLAKDPRAARRAVQDRHAETEPPLRGEVAQMLNAHMLNSDPPDHTRLRKLVSRAFTARRVEGLRTRVREIADRLIGDFPATGRTDVIDALAFPLPVMVICELLGVPVEDRDDFRTWSNALVSTSTPEQSAGAAEEMNAYLRRLLSAKRAEAGADLLSALIEVQDEEGRLSESELVSMAFLLLVAGHETTVNLIGNGLLALLARPEQMAKLRADPGLIPAAVEEFLRFDGPVNTATARFTTEPVTIAGVTIPAHQLVLVALGSADHDPARYDGADHLDITRDAGGHLAFGHGIHYCLGAPLARLEGQVAFESLLSRLENIALDVAVTDLTWRPGHLIRGLNALPVRYTARSAA
ncbi:cytochrome P450 [Spinactinospora alkalitolerans]|uniref:Cytochrome P450 n=1 Tax=Spinactinospora alkalitolerans TaxID=687207 RepID=A0A852TXH2_9ACTN|nr:cytochrome P450 [Spinactinospora alkalitolerans]NYE48451.1 cytochrome P450 [Spinactinospora alkalitolerans]